MGKAKTTSQRVGKCEQAQKAKGLTKCHPLCYPEDRDRIIKYAARLRKQRELGS